MITGYHCYNTITGKPVVVTLSGLAPEAKSTAAINAVLLSRDPGFVRAVGFALPNGRLMDRTGATIQTLALCLTEDYDGRKSTIWVELDALAAVEEAGVAMLAADAARVAEHKADMARQKLLAAELEAAAIVVVPVHLQQAWISAVEKLRESYCPNPLTEHVVRVGGGAVNGIREKRMFWDTSTPTEYDGGGSGYGRHAD